MLLVEISTPEGFSDGNERTLSDIRESVACHLTVEGGIAVSPEEVEVLLRTYNLFRSRVNFTAQVAIFGLDDPERMIDIALRLRRIAMDLQRLFAQLAGEPGVSIRYVSVPAEHWATIAGLII